MHFIIFGLYTGKQTMTVINVTMVNTYCNGCFIYFLTEPNDLLLDHSSVA